MKHLIDKSRHDEFASVSIHKLARNRSDGKTNVFILKISRVNFPWRWFMKFFSRSNFISEFLLVISFIICTKWKYVCDIINLYNITSWLFYFFLNNALRVKLPCIFFFYRVTLIVIHKKRGPKSNIYYFSHTTAETYFWWYHNGANNGITYYFVWVVKSVI